MKVKWDKAVIAGIVGTIVFDLVGFVLTGTFWDIPALLGSKLIGEGALLAGAVGHYANGVVIAIIYAGLAPSLWGNRWVRALTFITAQTIFGVWLFMMPLLGAGIMGLKAGFQLPIIALARHWAYGLVLAQLYPLEK